MQNIPWQKIEALENEIEHLKNKSKKKSAKSANKDLKLISIFKNLSFSEKEISEAKKSLFPFSSK